MYERRLCYLPLIAWLNDVDDVTVKRICRVPYKRYWLDQNRRRQVLGPLMQIITTESLSLPAVGVVDFDTKGNFKTERFFVLPLGMFRKFKRAYYSRIKEDVHMFPSFLEGLARDGEDGHIIEEDGNDGRKEQDVEELEVAPGAGSGPRYQLFVAEEEEEADNNYDSE